MKKIYYHVVTERPMELGKEIIFDDNHHSGVYDRVYAFKDKEMKYIRIQKIMKMLSSNII